MEIKISLKAPGKNQIWIIDDVTKLNSIPDLSKAESDYATKSINADQSVITLNRYGGFIFIAFLKNKNSEWQLAESCRKAGATIEPLCNSNKLPDVTITNRTSFLSAAVHLAEGLALSNYQFLKYKSDAAKTTNSLNKILFSKDSATVKEAARLQATIDAVYKARTLVNEPLSFLTAEQLSKEIAQMGKEAGFKVTVLNKARITKEKMGGLLAVNKGSIQPPTFTIMEYTPKKPLNKKPIVLVGKGIVFDTGGLTLKPTPNSMDKMKSDMGGAAVVSAAMYAIAKMQLPVHVIALIPATDNRPGQEAYVPGDVIKMYSGKTVEVLNTDAEGRMVLADALHWAKRYEPELVMDFATLTGAAAAAIGNNGVVCMGNAPDNVKQSLRKSGFNQYERLVEFPMWDEYGDLIKSTIADIKNVGGPYGGSITAGKFLEHFTDYNWMHFDISGTAFSGAKKGYQPVGGTAYGLRMLLDFLVNYGKA